MFIVKMQESSAEVRMHCSYSYNDIVYTCNRDLVYIGTSTCKHGDIQLTGGEKEGEGRVEVCYNGVWGTVCANGWDETAETLVCDQLGYDHGSEKMY